MEVASGVVSCIATISQTLLTTGGGGWKRDELEERQGGGGQWGGESRLGDFAVTELGADDRRRWLEARRRGRGGVESGGRDMSLACSRL